MIVSKFPLTSLSSLGLCDAKLEGYEGESAPLFLCVHPHNCPRRGFAVHMQLNNKVGNYLSLIKHFPSTLSLVVYFWASRRTAMNSAYLPLLTYLKWSNILVLHFASPLYCLSWDYWLCLDWDHVTLRQASHRVSGQGRKYSDFPSHGLWHESLSALFSQQALSSKIHYQLCVNNTLNKIKGHKFLSSCFNLLSHFDTFSSTVLIVAN